MKHYISMLAIVMLSGCATPKSTTEITPATSDLSRTEHRVDAPDTHSKHVIITIE